MKNSKLEWAVTPKADVATDGHHTFILLKKVPAGRPNRCHLFVVTPGHDPVVLGRELTPGHCRRLAQHLHNHDNFATELLSLVQAKAQLAHDLAAKHLEIAKKSPRP